MNKQKIKTIELTINELYKNKQILQWINTYLQEIVKIRVECEKLYNAATLPEDKNRELVNLIWRTKILWNGYVVSPNLNLYFQISELMAIIKNSFSDITDHSEIVSIDTVKSYRFIKLNHDDGSQQIEINLEPIKTYLNQFIFEPLNAAIEQLNNFITEQINDSIEKLGIDSPIPDMSIQNITKIKEMWDDKIKIYTELVQNLTIVCQDNCQKIINKLSECKSMIENGNEFLLLKHGRLITNIMFDQQAKLNLGQQKHAENFLENQRTFLEELQTIYGTQEINLKTTVITTFLNSSNNFIDHHLCITENINEAIHELHENFEKNIFANCPDKTIIAVREEMNQKVGWTNKYMIIANQLLAKKLIKSQNANLPLSIISWNQNNTNSQFKIFFSEINLLLNHLQNISQDILSNKLTDFQIEQQAFFENTVLPQEQIFENDLSIEILPEKAVDQSKVKKIKTSHNLTFGIENLVEKWNQVNETNLFQILNDTEKSWINENINKEVESAKTTLNIDKNKPFFTENFANNLADLKFWSRLIVDKLKEFIMTANEIITAATERWFQNSQIFVDNPFFEPIIDKVIETIVIQKNAIITFEKYLSDFETAFFESNKNDSINQIYTSSNFEFFDFKEAIWQIMSQQESLDWFKKEIIKLENMPLAPDLNDIRHIEIKKWKTNRGIVNFCTLPKTKSSLETKWLVTYKSKKTQILIQKWEEIYLHNLNIFYGDNELLFTKIQAIVEKIRVLKISAPKIQNGILSNYLKKSIGEQLDELEKNLNKLKQNQNRYLNDHEIKNIKLYQDCYQEQEDFRFKIYHDYKKIIVDTNILQPNSLSLIDYHIFNFQKLLNHQSNNEFNLKFGATWSEQLHSIYAKIDSSLKDLINAYHQVFQHQEKLIFARKKSNYFQQLIDKVPFKQNLSDLTKAENNFCTIPNYDSESLILTPEQITWICCQDSFPNYFANDNDLKLVDDELMFNDWIEIEKVLLQNTSNPKEITNLWSKPEKLSNDWQQIQQKQLPTENNHNNRFAINSSLLTGATLVGGVVLGAFCFCYYCLKKLRNHKPVITKETENLMAVKDKVESNYSRAMESEINAETSFL